MLNSNIPLKISIAFAANAQPGYIRQVPTPSQIGINDGFASFADGFPPLNFLAESAGGVPPNGMDMNGILNQITQWLRYGNAGGQVSYDQTFAIAIQGYPAGALLNSTTPGQQWLNLVDGNLTNPDVGGTNWASTRIGRLLNIVVYPNPGSFSYTPSSALVRTLIVTVIGGGGPGAGAAVTTAAQVSVGSGGAAGSYGKFMMPVTDLTATTTVLVGSPGVGVAGGPGTTGSGSAFGTFMICPPGQTGSTLTVSSSANTVAGQGVPGAPPAFANVSGKQVLLIAFGGAPGPCGIVFGGTPVSGQGANSNLGAGGANASVGSGNAGQGHGSGGAGAASQASTAVAHPGGNGTGGYVCVEEYA